MMNMHFLLSGYLFYWVVIGIDPGPRDVAPLTKLAMVFGTLPFHAFFGIALMSMDDRARRLVLSHPRPGLEHRPARRSALGGGIAWASGEVPLVAGDARAADPVVTQRQQAAKRIDRAADRDNDADLTAYNAMYAELARRDGEVRR